MRVLIGTILLVGIGVASYLLGGAAREAFFPSAPRVEMGSSLVYLDADTGNGSGTHLGGGLILTAAHVVGANETMKVITDAGQELEAKPLWSNEKLDVALLQVEGKLAAKQRPLACRKAEVGEEVWSYGNPLWMRGVTTRGFVSSTPQEIKETGLRAMVITAPMAPGMSGGPVVDVYGAIIGINTAITMMPAGPFQPNMTTGLMLSVPAEVICPLFGRPV